MWLELSLTNSQSQRLVYKPFWLDTFDRDKPNVLA